MVHSNTGINEVNWNPDGPRNAPDSWPHRLKVPPTPCHDATRPPEARGACDIPLYKLEVDCNAARGTWVPHHNWNPGAAPCCGGFNYDGTEQEACRCGPGTGRPCRDCPHDCRVVIGRYPFNDGPTSYTPKYLDPIFGCSTQEYCTRADDVYPWITSGCDCCGPCCPAMIGVEHVYEHESFATLDAGHCYPINTHTQYTDRASCEGNQINGVSGTWITTDEEIPTPAPDAQGNYPDGVCFEAGPVLDTGKVLLPGGSRKQTGATTEATCDGVWVPINRLNSNPPGCLPPNKCSDNCGGSQVGVCKDSSGDILWGTSKGDCASPNVWSEDACHTQPPCCEKRGMRMYAKPGFETLKAQISGCSCPGGVCETDLVWMGGAGLPISISPWEKFGGIDPYKELVTSIEGQAGPPSLAVADFIHINSFNIENTCGVWAGAFGSCAGCGHFIALYDVECPNCGYLSHPLTEVHDDTHWVPGHDPGVSNDPFDATCIDFPSIQPAPACTHIFKDFINLDGNEDAFNCHKCCQQSFGKPHGECGGTCEDPLTGGTIQAGSGYECVQAGGDWKLDCESGEGSGGGAPNPGLDGPGQGNTSPPSQDCGINCTNPSEGYFRCDCADTKAVADKYGIPLCREVVTECGDTECNQKAFAAPGTCCDWATVAGTCESQQIINRGQRCGKGNCECCEGCPSCEQDRYGNLVQSTTWCNIPDEGPGCSKDVAYCDDNVICHENIKCNGVSAIGKGAGSTCECPECPPPPPECPYYPCRVGNVHNGAPIVNAPGNPPLACMCGMSVAGIKYHPDHGPKSIFDGKGDCTLYCDGSSNPYWATQLCPTPVSASPDAPDDPNDPDAPGSGQDSEDLPGQGGVGGVSGGGFGDELVNECAGCGEIYPRLIADCNLPSICGCGQSNWTGRCDNPCGPSIGDIQTVYLVCHQESSCKEDCDGLGVSREWRGECNKERCGAKKGGTVCAGGGSQYWPPDPPHAGNDGKFRWGTWGDESECPCGPSEDDQFIDCECQGPTPGQVECMGATGRCGGGPHHEGVMTGGTLCQNQWKGTDRYACGHEWFTPPWGWPPVCGGGCGTHDGKLTENTSSGVCEFPGPDNPCTGMDREILIDKSTPFGTSLDCMGDPEKNGRCSCDPANWDAYSNKTACNEDGYEWITYNWIETNGVCWHRAGHRVFTKANGDLVVSEAECLAEGSCIDANCQGSGCDLPACADKWSTIWRPQNDPYWYDTQFAIANQEDPTAAAAAGNPYPKYVSLLEYRYGGLGDSCYDGCMCGSVEPTCEAGGGCPDMPNCLGACFSCEGNEWEITEAECRRKIAECTAQGGQGQGSGGATQTGGGGGTADTPGGYEPGAGAGGTGGTGGGGGAGSGSQSSSYDWKPNPFYPQGCFVPPEICKGCLSCSGNEPDVCGGCAGKACNPFGASGHREHCLSKGWCDEFPKVGDCGANCSSRGCTGGGCGNYNPVNWKHRQCGKTCNHFEVVLGGAAYRAGYKEGAIKHISKPECRLFAPDTCCPDTIHLEGQDRPAPFVRISQIDVLDYGEGYTIPPEVTIDDPTFVPLPLGIKATAAAYIDKDTSSADYGKLTEVLLSNKGLGYADPQSPPPVPITIQATLSKGCAFIDANETPNTERCGVCVAREHKTKTDCQNSVGVCTDRNGDEVPEHTNMQDCEGDGTYGRTWVPSPGCWVPLRQGTLRIRLEAWAGDCERKNIVDKDQKFKSNAACDCIPFKTKPGKDPVDCDNSSSCGTAGNPPCCCEQYGDEDYNEDNLPYGNGCPPIQACIPGNPPNASHGHRYEDYICDDVIMTSWEKLGSEVKTGNVINIWNATNPKKPLVDPDRLQAFINSPSSFNGSYEIQRISSHDYSLKLKCSGRKVSAFQDECQAGYCKDCQDGCPDGASCPDGFKDCCTTGKNGTDRQRCEERRRPDPFNAQELIGGCGGEWVPGTCDEVLPNCPNCDGRGKCLYNGKCKDTNGDRNIHNGKCLGNEAHDAENCTNSSLTLEQNIAQCKENCLNDSADNCWLAAEGCKEECCGCYDCQDTAVGLKCPECCWDTNSDGTLKRCDGGCSNQTYDNQVDCEANGETWKEGPMCPDGCPQRKEDCCGATCHKDNIIKTVDVLDMGAPIIPFDRARPICGNPDHPDFGGLNAAANRGLPSCEKCTNTWSGEWDEVNGKCNNVSTYKFRCGYYAGDQETSWESGCCEEKSCEADTCGSLPPNRGDCCGLWSTSACACPSDFKDCDGNLIKDAEGNPQTRPFVLELETSGGAGCGCGDVENIVGLVEGTMQNVGSFPQFSTRIIITEST